MGGLGMVIGIEEWGERQYKEPEGAVRNRLCECGHALRGHGGIEERRIGGTGGAGGEEQVEVRSGICLMGGCDCRGFRQRGGSAAA